MEKKKDPSMITGKPFNDAPKTGIGVYWGTGTPAEVSYLQAWRISRRVKAFNEGRIDEDGNIVSHLALWWARLRGKKDTAGF